MEEKIEYKSGNLLENVRKYLRETPTQEVMDAWDATEHLKNVGPTVDDYIELGKAFCEGNCDRKVIRTSEGTVIVCDYCNRVVMDRRM